MKNNQNKNELWIKVPPEHIKNRFDVPSLSSYSKIFLNLFEVFTNPAETVGIIHKDIAGVERRLIGKNTDLKDYKEGTIEVTLLGGVQDHSLIAGGYRPYLEICLNYGTDYFEKIREQEISQSVIAPNGKYGAKVSLGGKINNPYISDKINDENLKAFTESIIRGYEQIQKVNRERLNEPIKLNIDELQTVYSKLLINI